VAVEGEREREGKKEKKRKEVKRRTISAQLPFDLYICSTFIAHLASTPIPSFLNLSCPTRTLLRPLPSFFLLPHEAYSLLSVAGLLLSSV